MIIIGTFQDSPQCNLIIDGIEKGYFSKKEVLKMIDEQIKMPIIQKRGAVA